MLDPDQPLPTPFSPCSFDYYPGQKNNNQIQSNSFRFTRVAPTKPLPSVPYGSPEEDSDFDTEEEEEEEEEQSPMRVVRRRHINARPTTTNNNSKKATKLSGTERFKWLLVHFPYGTLLASLLCITGGILFAVEVHTMSDLTLVTLQEVMHTSYPWIETLEIVCTAAGCLLAALSMLILASTCVTSLSHIGEEKSSTCSLILLLLLYPALFVWGTFMLVSVTSTFVNALLDGVCQTDEIKPIWTYWDSNDGNTICKTIERGEKCVQCIDLYPYHFLFPADARKEDMWICGREIWLFCDEDLPKIVYSWILCLISSIMVLVGVSVHLAALSYTRTQIEEENKLKMYQESRYIRTRVRSVLHSRSNSADVGHLLRQTHI